LDKIVSLFRRHFTKDFYEEVNSICKVKKKGELLRGLIDENGERIIDKNIEIEVIVKFYTDQLFRNQRYIDWKETSEWILQWGDKFNPNIGEEQVILAIKGTNLDKSCGADLFFPS
jgi:hypothetical protein